MDIHILETILGFVGGTGLTSILLIKEKKKGAQLDNQAKISAEYNHLIERQNAENAELREENKMLKGQINDLWNEINKLKSQIASLIEQGGLATATLNNTQEFICAAAKTCETRKLFNCTNNETETGQEVSSE